MTIQELGTIMQSNIPVKILVLNNNFLDGLDLNTREEISKILKFCVYGIICCNIYAFFLIYYGADKLSELE